MRGVLAGLMIDDMNQNNAHVPCWSRATRENTITRIASMGDENRDRFLATHSPIKNLQKDSSKEKITENDALSDILDFTTKEATIVVKGAPGTGKSHFINWLKLSCDYERGSETLDDALVVLIQRRTGSLKDTLEQLIEQLPTELHVYLEPVRSAITALSTDELKTRLAQSIYNHFTHRTGDKVLPRQIKHLPQAFVEQGFGTWLTRDGGTIDKNVKLLTSSSEIYERSSIPQFSSEDFIIEDKRLKSRALNSNNILDLVAEIEDDPDETLSLLVDNSNEVLRNSLQELLGLNNTALTDIFNNIRRDLKNNGKRLILLIEDVSTLSVLDHEIVNAVEPNNDNSLCRITSVLGMTEVAFSAMRDNQKQRLSLVLSLPEDTASTGWLGSPQDADNFLARYLNAIRMSDDQIAGLIVDLRSTNKMTRSACVDCEVKQKCHELFGKVEIDEVPIGLYPFRENTTSKLLSNLSTESGYGKTQRGLIEEIINPTLTFFESLAANKQPRLNLNLDTQYASYFTELTQRYLKNWDRTDTQLYNILSNHWSNLTEMEEVINDIKPLLPYFKLPNYTENTSSKVTPTPVRRTITAQPVERPKKPETSGVVLSDLDENKFQQENNKLIKWTMGEPYEQPSNMQTYIKNFFYNSFAYLNAETAPNLGLRKVLNKHNSIEIISIEDMNKRSIRFTNPFKLKRSKESYDLLDALLRFEFHGKQSWNFEGGEKYKQSAFSWFRKHREQIFDIFAAQSRDSDENSKLDEQLPLNEAIKLLYLMKTIVLGKKLPTDPEKQLQLLFEKNDGFQPKALSQSLLNLHNDLEQFSRATLDFILTEICQPQGSSTTSFKIIDPTPVISVLSNRENLLSFEELDPGYFVGASRDRYAELSKLKQWKMLSSALQDELLAVCTLMEKIDAIFTKWNFKHSQKYEFLGEWYDEIGNLIDVARDILTIPKRDLQVWYVGKSAFPTADTAKMLSSITQIIDGENLEELLCFDTQKLQAYADFIHEIDAKLKYIEGQCEARAAVTIISENPENYLNSIRSDLTRITAGV